MTFDKVQQGSKGLDRLGQRIEGLKAGSHLHQHFLIVILNYLQNG